MGGGSPTWTTWEMIEGVAAMEEKTQEEVNQSLKIIIISGINYIKEKQRRDFNSQTSRTK